MTARFRRYLTPADAERLTQQLAALYDPGKIVASRFGPGFLGRTIGADYYVVPDDDPRAGTEETIHEQV